MLNLASTFVDAKVASAFRYTFHTHLASNLASTFVDAIFASVGC